MTRLLLVADAAWVSNDVAASMIDPGTHLTEIADPRRAVETAAELRPHLVLVDLQVGSMGGMAVTRALRDAMAQGRVEPAPVVMLLDRSADTFLARRAGAAGWVLKPFTAQELRAVIDSVLSPTPT